MSEKTVFISYHRDAAGKAFARSIKQELTHRGYDAFLDVDDIAAGDWAKQILTQVPKRAHFLLLVTPGALDACSNPEDWIRREFALARDRSRNIVPVFEESVDIAKLRQQCPSAMQGIFDFQGLALRHDEFTDGISRLINHYIPPHKAPVDVIQAAVVPKINQPYGSDKPPILLIALMTLAFVILAAVVVVIVKLTLGDVDVRVPAATDVGHPQQPAEAKSLVLDDVDEVQADNTHVIYLKPPEKKHLSHLMNMGNEPEQFRLPSFPHDVFYTNLDDDENRSINAGESKSLRLILIALAPERKEYAFEIQSTKHTDSLIRVSIRLQGDWKAFHQQQLQDWAEKTKTLNAPAQLYQAALQVIDRENPDLERGAKQALTGQFLVHAGRTDAAVLAFADADKSVPKTVERLVFAATPSLITALGKHYETQQDYAKAASWYTAAANTGYAESEYSLGKLFASGNGIPQDKAAAQAWFRKAAEQGHPGALQSTGSGDESKPLDPPKPGASAKDCPTCPEMVDIPAGSFMMGSDAAESTEPDEKPRHKVDIAAFKLGKYEITQAEWTAVMGSNPSHFSECGPGCPVDRVSYDDVQAFIAKLNRLTGRHYRLPTEAEWEYAARAGTVTAFSTGACITTDLANYDGNVAYKDCAKTGVYLAKTRPVGSYPANPWGLYDMHGNVWEWTCSIYTDSYAGRENACVDDSVLRSWPRRVIRGGSWDSGPGLLRSAGRSWDYTGNRYDYIGFRLAQD